MRRFFSICGGLILLSFLSCSGSGSKCERFISVTLNECRSTLEAGKYSSTIEECNKVLNPPDEMECSEVSAEVSCEAHYALLIAHILSLVDAIPSIQLPPLTPTSAMSPPLIPLQNENQSFTDFYDTILLALQGENLTELFGSQTIFGKPLTEVIPYLQLMAQLKISPEEILLTILNPFLSIFYEIDREASYVIDNNCSITMDRILVPNTTMELRGEWDQTEAYLLKGIAQTVKGVVDLVFSYNLDFSINYLINILLKVAGMTIETNYTLLDALRDMGGLLYGSPEFLTWDEQRKGLFNYADKELGTGLIVLGNFLQDLFSEQDSNPGDDFIYWIDSDESNTPTPGDEFCIHIHNANTGENTLKSICDLLSSVFISEEVINNYINLFTELGQGIKGDLGEDYRISIKKIFDSLSFSIIQISIEDVLFFLPRKFFGNPDERAPLREFMPYFYDPDGEGDAPVVFLIEGEVFPGEGTKYVDGTIYQHEGDSSHFAIGTQWNNTDSSVGTDGSIKSDCVTLTSALSKWTLYYFAMKNPSWNGAIEVNPGAGSLSSDGCNDPNSIQPANNYTLNKALAHLQVNLYPFLDTILQLLSGGLPF